MKEEIGFIGMAIIIIAWLPGIAKTIKTKKPGMEKNFIALYFTGSVLLAYYAYINNSIPFLILNILACTIPLIHLYFHLKQN
ncbi:MAG: hypothetical protein QXZ13_01070 [Candidatus Diapherotrites archaeon]